VRFERLEAVDDVPHGVLVRGDLPVIRVASRFGDP
jgi:hypothetical protein